MNKLNLTIDNIRSLVQEQTKYIVSDKLYYNKFAYNISMKNHSLWHTGEHIRYQPDPFTQTTRWFDDPKLVHERKSKFAYHYAKQKRIMKLMDRLDIEYRFRREKHFNLYINDPGIVKRMIDSVPEEIISIAGPKSEEHLNILRGGRKVVVRDRLYYKKYRFKMSYYANHEFTQTLFPAIENALPSIGFDRIKLSSNYYRLRRQQEIKNRKFKQFTLARTVDPWHYITIYFEDEEDLILFKMMVGGTTKTEVEVMLHSELQNDK